MIRYSAIAAHRRTGNELVKNYLLNLDKSSWQVKKNLTKWYELMSIRRLKTLIAIAEYGTFADAAKKVLLSKAAVSQQMKSLEDEFGMLLFDRSKRSPRLNPLGQVMVPKARNIIRSYEELAPSLLEKSMIEGELTIGALPTTMSGLIPRSLGILRTTYPSLHIRIVPKSNYHEFEW